MTLPPTMLFGLNDKAQLGAGRRSGVGGGGREGRQTKLLLLKMCQEPVAPTSPGAWAESSVPDGLKGNLHFKEILKRSAYVLKLERPNPKLADNGPVR